MLNTARSAISLLLLPGLLLGLGLGLSGCPEGHDNTLRVDIRGLTPEAAADTITDKMCQHMEACGAVSYECSGSPDGPTTCTGTIEPMPYTECYAEIHTEIRTDLLCAELTSSQESLVNDCINAMLSYPCLTQAQVDANAAAYAAGEEAPYAQEPPPICGQLEPIFEACGEEGEDELDEESGPR